jgi:hypothetical protein
MPPTCRRFDLRLWNLTKPSERLSDSTWWKRLCAALFVGFSDDRRFFVLVLLLVFFVLVIIVVIRVSRRGRSADEGPLEQLGGNVLGDARSHVGACLDFEVFADWY